MRDRIWNMVTGYLTAFSLMVAGFVYFTDKVKDIDGSYLKIFCYIFLVLIMLTLASSIFCLVRAVSGYEYHYITSPKKIETHAQSLKNYYKESFNEDIIKRSIYENYRDFAHHNGELNFKRMLWVTRAFRILTIALIASAILVVPYVFFKKANVQKIEIITNSTVGGNVYGR